MSAWIELLICSVALRCVGLGAVRRRAERPTPTRDTAAVDAERVRRVVARAARHHVVPAACLEQSIVVQLLLRRQGVRARLAIGVRRDGDEVAAHAWVEVGGRPLGEDRRVRTCFAPLEAAAR